MTTASSPTQVDRPEQGPDEPLDDVSSAPESGTVRDSTCGNNPAKGGDFTRETEPTPEDEAERASHRRGEPSSDVWSAPESGTVRE